MDHIGIDVAKVKSQMCILSDDGVVLERRFKTCRDELVRLLGNRAPAKVLVESCGESEWIARIVEELGHEVIVADPSYRVMYGARSPGIKTDRRDAEALAIACRMGAYRPSHRQSEPQRRLRRTIVVREALVRTRAKFVTLAQALLRQDGIRIATGGTETFIERVRDSEIPEHLRAAVEPLLVAIAPLNEQIESCDEIIERQSETDERAKLLRTVPGVGPLTSVVFVNTIDDVGRFKDPHQFEAYLGLVPREYSSGERQSRGGLTKAGDARTRMLLIEAALRIRRLKNPKTERLWSWSEQIAQRRGKKVATVALARRLAGIMFAMLRDKTEFRPSNKEAAASAAA